MRFFIFKKLVKVDCIFGVKIPIENLYNYEHLPKKDLCEEIIFNNLSYSEGPLTDSGSATAWYQKEADKTYTRLEHGPHVVEKEPK